MGSRDKPGDRSEQELTQAIRPLTTQIRVEGTEELYPVSSIPFAIRVQSLHVVLSQTELNLLSNARA